MTHPVEVTRPVHIAIAPQSGYGHTARPSSAIARRTARDAFAGLTAEDRSYVAVRTAA